MRDADDDKKEFDNLCDPTNRTSKKVTLKWERHSNVHKKIGDWDIWSRTVYKRYFPGYDL